MKKFNVRFSINLDHSGLTTINWTPFWAGLVMGFIMAGLSYFVPVNKLVNPFPWKNDILREIRPRLEQKINNFRLTKTIEVIPAAQATSVSDNSTAYAVIDYDTGEIISDKNLSQRLPIASLTKIMSAVVALDLSSPEEYFSVSHRAAAMIPTKIGVVPGQKMMLGELLPAALLTSANDAAEVIMEGVDAKYGQAVFVEAMNMKAEFLGLKNTHFANPQGFDNEDNYSTVEDLAILSHYALTSYPLIAEIVKKDYQFLESDGNHKQFDLYNWNGLVDVYPNVFGVKIGNTNLAGTTTVVAAEREGKRILAVLLGTPDILERDLSASQLLDLGFEKKFNLAPVNVTEDDLRVKYATWKTF